MEVVMSSSVHDCSRMENERGVDAAKLIISHKKRKRKQVEREANENPDNKPEIPLPVTDLGKIATSDAKMVSKEEHTNVANGEMGLTLTENLVPESTIQKKKKKKSRKEISSLGETSNLPHLEETKIEDSGTDVGTTVTDETVVKKKKKQKLENENNLDFQETVIAKKPTLTELLNPKHLEELEVEDAKRALCKKMKKKKKKKKMEASLKEIDSIPDVIVAATSARKKKLLVFDVNGLLADIIFKPRKNFKADKLFKKRAIMKRPSLDDFLSFCFERFHIGIWSSRTKEILDPVVDFLLGDLRSKLLFCWNGSSCTDIGIQVYASKGRRIAFKDLRKIWDKNGPDNLWVKGDFDESNTLLIDDSPYKALLNPKHTGIFPETYKYSNKNDNFLAPNGELRSYLEGVESTDNLKMYVEQHPFGQGAIDENHRNWEYYLRAIRQKKNIIGHHWLLTT